MPKDPVKDLIILDEDSDISDLSVPQWRAAQMLVLTGDTRKAANEAEVTPSTIRSWLKKNDPFQAAVKELLEATKSELKIELALGIGEAISKLRDLIDDKAKGISLGACKAMVDAVKKIDTVSVTVEEEETFIADGDTSRTEELTPETMKQINKILRIKKTKTTKQ